LTNPRYKEESGLKDFLKVLDTMDEFDFIEYDYEDIVRSGLVKSYIIARDKLGL
jgi:phosphate starvation-inducible protein PhoH